MYYDTAEAALTGLHQVPARALAPGDVLVGFTKVGRCLMPGFREVTSFMRVYRTVTTVQDAGRYVRVGYAGASDGFERDDLVWVRPA